MENKIKLGNTGKNFIKFVVFATFVTGIVLLIVELTKNNGDKPPDGGNGEPNKPPVGGNGDKPPVGGNGEPNKINVDTVIQYLKTNGVKMLGSDECGRTEQQREIFEHKLKSNDIYVNCDQIQNCISLLPPGTTSIQYPEWVMDKKILSSGKPLDIKTIYELVKDNQDHADVYRNRLRGLKQESPCTRYI